MEYIDTSAHSLVARQDDPVKARTSNSVNTLTTSAITYDFPHGDLRSLDGFFKFEKTGHCIDFSAGDQVVTEAKVTYRLLSTFEEVNFHISGIEILKNGDLGMYLVFKPSPADF